MHTAPGPWVDLAIRTYNICIPRLWAWNVVFFFAAKEFAFNSTLIFMNICFVLIASKVNHVLRSTEFI